VNANGFSTSVTFEYGITTDYGQSITASQSPVIGNTNVNVTTNLTGLLANTTYHFRIKAGSIGGIIYSDNNSFTTQPIITVTDYDGNVYQTIQIGSQLWMKENLKSLHYADGTNISGVYTYMNNEIYVTPYGRLYTWDAAMNNSINPSTQGVCPAGWHLPSGDEVQILIDYLGGFYLAGGKLKQEGYTYWNEPNTGADNSSGFTALPSGYGTPNNLYGSLGDLAFLWTSSQNGTYKWLYILHKDDSYCGIMYNHISNCDKEKRYAVRCIKN